MRFSLFLAAVAAITAGVEAIAISSNVTSDLLPSTTRRRGCGRLSPSDASPSVSKDASDATSSATFSTLSSIAGSNSPETLSVTVTSVSIENSDPIISSINSSIEASETISVTTSGAESNTQASLLASSRLSTTDSATLEPTEIVLPTLITTEPISKSSITTVPTISSTESTTETITSDVSTVSVTVFSIGTSTEITSSMTETPTTIVSESSATSSTSLETTSTLTTTTPICSPTNTINGDFEAGPSNWTFTGNGAILVNGDDDFNTPYGSYFAILYGSLDTPEIFQAVSNVASTAIFSFNFRLYSTWSISADPCSFTATYDNITLGTRTLYQDSIAATSWQSMSWPAANAPSSGTLRITWVCSSNMHLAVDNVFLTSSCPEDSVAPIKSK